MSSRLLKNSLLGLVGAVIIAVGISLFTTKGIENRNRFDSNQQLALSD